MNPLKPERWTPQMWRVRCPTVGAMIDHRWEVWSSCITCHLEMKTPLKALAAVQGRDFVLWNARLPCRRRRCSGQVRFYARAPELNQDLRLDAGWPESWGEARHGEVKT